MIKSKKCLLCDKPAFSKGYCQVHSPKKEIKSTKKGIKSRRETTTVKKIEMSEKRSVYFDYHIEKCIRSEFSGQSISKPTRANICHLIDKSRHPSLQDNLENYIYLTFTEHQRYDQLLFSHRFEDLEKEFKNSWDLSCERIINLLPLCLESTNFIREIQKYIDGRDFKSE